MRRVDLSIPQLGFVVATRAALGVGIALLAADRLRRSKRLRLGSALVAVGALTTVPAAYILFGRSGAARLRAAK